MEEDLGKQEKRTTKYVQGNMEERDKCVTMPSSGEDGKSVNQVAISCKSIHSPLLNRL